jgi:Na+-transporting methylmalonyl-CoA/oxaloacetate decarboxylase gamma subunit
MVFAVLVILALAMWLTGLVFRKIDAGAEENEKG